MKIINFTIPLGIILGIVFLYQIIQNRSNEINFEDLALGKETTSVYLSKVNGRVIHCGDLKDIDICLEDYNTLKVSIPVTLLLGNSQLHAINKFLPGNETVAPELHRRFFKYDEYFLTLSQANANLQEHYLLFAYLLNRLPIKKLALPLVFDDMREEGIRNGISDSLNDPGTIKYIVESKTGQNLINENNKISNYDVAALEGTVQENVENILNKNLEKIWPLWTERQKMRGTFFNYLYKVRNTLFGINPSSIRKIIPGRYAKNIESLSAILKLASKQNIQVTLYITPLRNDVKIPYDLAEYKKFKSDISLISKQYNSKILNLENLVPAELWGSKESTSLKKTTEIDFMHFQDGGHRLLADALFQALVEEK